MCRKPCDSPCLVVNPQGTGSHATAASEGRTLVPRARHLQIFMIKGLGVRTSCAKALDLPFGSIWGWFLQFFTSKNGDFRDGLWHQVYQVYHIGTLTNLIWFDWLSLPFFSDEVGLPGSCYCWRACSGIWPTWMRRFGASDKVARGNPQRQDLHHLPGSQTWQWDWHISSSHACIYINGKIIYKRGILPEGMQLFAKVCSRSCRFLELTEAKRVQTGSRNLEWNFRMLCQAAVGILHSDFDLSEEFLNL